MNRPSWNLEPCGTDAAYRRHYRKGQKPCQQCKDAHNLAVEAREQERNAIRRGRYAEARAAGMNRDQAGRFSKLSDRRMP